jgi:hypothetical protein
MNTASSAKKERQRRGDEFTAAWRNELYCHVDDEAAKAGPGMMQSWFGVCCGCLTLIFFSGRRLLQRGGFVF